MTRIQQIEQKYKRRRNHRLIIWVIASLLITLTLSAQATPKTAADLERYVTVTVSEGESLWNIAQHINQVYYENKMDPNDLVKHIKEVNHIQSVVIHEGQVLKVSMTVGQ